MRIKPTHPVPGRPGRVSIAVAAMLVILATGCHAASPAVPKGGGGGAGGVYVDYTGARRSWSVDRRHALHWEGRPWVPVGGMFCFAYLSEYNAKDPRGNESRWARDVALLAQIRRAGLADLYVNPVNPATRYPPQVWNRCLRELDRLGFRYGIELTDGPTQGMDGYMLAGDNWKALDKGGEVAMTWKAEFGQVPRMSSILAVSLDSGRVASMPIRTLDRAVLYPEWTRQEKVVFIPRIRAPLGFNVANLWDGWAEYEERLARLLGSLHRGSGLRMVVDPLTNEMNYYDYTAQMVPASEGFRSGYAKWLEHRYSGELARLAKAWGASPGTTFPARWEVAARLLPVPQDPDAAGLQPDPTRKTPAAPSTRKTTSAGSARAASASAIPDPGGSEALGEPDPGPSSRPPPAFGLLVDPVTLAGYQVEPRSSRVLEDLRDYRDESVGSYCHHAGTLVKRHLGELPVVVKHTGRFMRFLLGMGAGTGIDGLGMEVWGADRREMAKSAGGPVSLLRHWNRPGWLLVTESAPSSEPKGKPPGYPSRDAMWSHLDALAAYGARGFFLFALRPLPEQLLPDFCLYKDPRQLDWLAAYARELARPGSRSQLLERHPRVQYERARRGPGLRVPGWEAPGGDARISELKGHLLFVPAYADLD